MLRCANPVIIAQWVPPPLKWCPAAVRPSIARVPPPFPRPCRWATTPCPWDPTAPRIEVHNWNAQEVRIASVAYARCAPPVPTVPPQVCRPPTVRVPARPATGAKRGHGTVKKSKCGVFLAKVYGVKKVKLPLSFFWVIQFFDLTNPSAFVSFFAHSFFAHSCHQTVPAGAPICIARKDHPCPCQCRWGTTRQTDHPCDAAIKPSAPPVRGVIPLGCGACVPRVRTETSMACWKGVKRLAPKGRIAPLGRWHRCPAQPDVLATVPI